MDPLESLSLKKDSTLAMIRAAQARGWQVGWLGPGELLLHEGRAHGLIRSLRLTDAFAESLDPSVAASAPWYERGEEVLTPLADLDVIMMRKDPPFNLEYVYATYFLERAADDGVLVVNRPQSLREPFRRHTTTWSSSRWTAWAAPPCSGSWTATPISGSCWRP